MSNKGKILVVGSSTDCLTLKDGRKEHAGYYLNEIAIPLRAAIDAGYEIVLATPKGNKPVMDPQSAVVSHFGGSEEALQEALDFVSKYPAMQKPRSLRSAIEEGLDDYIGVYAPGGHPPIIDLMQDPDLGEVLRHFHAAAKPTVFLCHGPVALTAAMPDAKKFRAAMAEGNIEAAKKAAEGWQYAGYRMTVFSNDEEHYVEEKLMEGGKVPFYVLEALTIAGGKLEIAPEGIFKPHVVEDRELITGQNPPSDHRIADLLVKALDRCTAAVAA
jgi:putative intracellular protease/amidase